MKGNFQIILIVVFLVAAVFGVFVFSGTIKIGKDRKQAGPEGEIVFWGTVRVELINDLIEKFNESNQGFSLKYIQKQPDEFDRDLLEALATGTGPDIFMLPNDLIYHYRNKVYGIPYDRLSPVAFKTNFASAGEVFVNSKGIVALPLSIDPIIMYYNRSLLDSAGIVYPPSTWEELRNIVSLLTKKDDDNKISQSTVALGQIANITNAKDIISSFILQTGNTIVEEKPEIGYVSTLEDPTKYSLENTLDFYTNFADPLNELYSWNRSLPESRDMFSSENLAIYFGYASELETLINRNPNQNFMIAPFPQIKGSNTKVTYAKVNGVAISAGTKNFEGAYAAASGLTLGEFALEYADAVGFAPARRDILSKKKDDIYSPIIYNSALFARSWLDPEPKDSYEIIKRMIENILSNNLTISDSIIDAQGKMNLLLIK